MPLSVSDVAPVMATGTMSVWEAAKIDSRLYTVTGGFHLVLTPEEEVQRVAGVLHDTLKIERVAPGHCTSELGFAVFLERVKERFDRTRLGAVISLPKVRCCRGRESETVNQYRARGRRPLAIWNKPEGRS